MLFGLLVYAHMGILKIVMQDCFLLKTLLDCTRVQIQKFLPLSDMEEYENRCNEMDIPGASFVLCSDSY